MSMSMSKPTSTHVTVEGVNYSKVTSTLKTVKRLCYLKLTSTPIISPFGVSVPSLACLHKVSVLIISDCSTNSTFSHYMPKVRIKG